MLSLVRRFELRPALSRDLEAIAHLERASFDRPNAFEVFADAIADAERELYVHTSQDAIDAYLLWHISRDQVRIEGLAVHEGHRGRGIATRALEWLSARYAATRRITATFSERNVPMQLLLSQLGFRCVRIERGLYASDDLALTFRLTPARALEVGLVKQQEPADDQA